jgi:hypothetical protein
MEGKYLVESESEDEASDSELEAVKVTVVSDGWQLQDIDQVRT